MSPPNTVINYGHRINVRTVEIISTLVEKNRKKNDSIRNRLFLSVLQAIKFSVEGI